MDFAVIIRIIAYRAVQIVYNLFTLLNRIYCIIGTTIFNFVRARARVRMCVCVCVFNVNEYFYDGIIFKTVFMLSYKIITENETNFEKNLLIPHESCVSISLNYQRYWNCTSRFWFVLAIFLKNLRLIYQTKHFDYMILLHGVFSDYKFYWITLIT